MILLLYNRRGLARDGVVRTGEVGMDKLPVERSGRRRIDALALRRAAEHPADRECSVCQSCGAGATTDDVWRVRWTYYFIPNRAMAVLAPLMAVTGAGFVHDYTEQVHHFTHHVICPGCAGAARRGRLLGGLLRFVGLFVGICGL